MKRAWVGVEGRSVAAGVHVPRDEAVVGVVVVVPPVGFEGEVTYRTVHALADRAAAAGFLALAMDPSGMGDSGALPPGNVVSAWQAEVDAAVEYAHLYAPGVPVNTVGFRLGAFLADRPHPLVSRVVCVEPISGRGFIRKQQLLLHLRRENSGAGHKASRDVLALQLSSEQREAIKWIPVPGPDDGRRVIISDPDRESAEYLYTGDPYYSVIPTETLSSIIGALARGKSVPVEHVESVSSCTFGDIRKPITESFDVVGPHGLHAIVTEPNRRPKSGFTCVIFSAQGFERSSGPAHLWTAIARELATCGIVALRVDRRGIGLLTDSSELRAPNPFTEEAVADICAAVDHARKMGAERVVIVSSCAGAWLALDAAHDRRVEHVVALSVPAWSSRTRDFGRHFLDRWHGPGPAFVQGVQVPRGGALRRFAAVVRRSHVLSRSLTRPYRVLQALAVRSVGLPVLCRVRRETGVSLLLGGRDLTLFKAAGGPATLRFLRLMGRDVRLMKVDAVDHALRTAPSHTVVRTIVGGAVPEYADSGIQPLPSLHRAAGPS